MTHNDSAKPPRVLHKNQIYSPCPSCGSSSLAVIESRSTKVAIRRRKQCQACSHRCTTYEVSSDWFRQAEDNARLRDVLVKQLALQPVVTPVAHSSLPCLDCGLARQTACELGLPEFGTSEAMDCIHHQPIHPAPARYIA
jgi:hypothetical protein